MPGADAGVFPNAERSHSGLVHRSRKPEWVNAHRGFESHPLRQLFIGPIGPIRPILSGEVQEWLNWQHWKCCERETVPWVRIPPSPPYIVPRRPPQHTLCLFMWGMQ